MPPPKFLLEEVNEGKWIYKKLLKKQPALKKSLAIMVASLQGLELRIELKNDDEIVGTVEECDDRMNINLLNVRVKHSGELSDMMDSYLLQGSSIRYIHIPQTVQPIKCLDDYLKKVHHISSFSKPQTIKSRIKT